MIVWTFLVAQKSKVDNIQMYLFVWGGCFQPQIVTQLVEATSRRERVYVLYVTCFQNASSLYIHDEKVCVISSI